MIHKAVSRPTGALQLSRLMMQNYLYCDSILLLRSLGRYLTIVDIISDIYLQTMW